MKPTWKTLAAFLAAAPVVLSASKIEKVAGEPIQVDAQFGYESEYVFRGVKQLGHNLQSGVNFSLLGAYGDIRLITDGSDTDFTEIDYTVGYTHAREDLSLDVGFTFYTFNQNRADLRREADDTYEVYLGAAYALGNSGLTPSLYLFYDFELEDFTIEAALNHHVALKEDLGIESGVRVGHLFADNSRDDRFYYQANIDLVYNLNEAAYGKVGGRLAGNDSNIDPDPTLWWGASVGVAF